MNDLSLSPGLSRRPHTLWRRLLAVTLLMVLLGAGLLWSQRETLGLAARGYVFGYPLVLADLTRHNFVSGIAPANRLVHMSTFPDADFREFVRPNVDTLYTQAWLDMDAGPWVFEVPGSQRYLLMQFLDAWSNVFASLGSRTLGSQGGRFLLVGPGWQGEVPPGLTLLRSPTRLSWLLGRIQTNGKADYPAVHAIQAGIQLRSLDDWQRGAASPALPFSLPEKPVMSPLYQMRALSAQDFFARLAGLLQDNPATAADAAAIAELQQLGLRAGEAPQWSWLQSQTARLGIWLAEREMQQSLQRTDGLVNGWRQPPVHIGTYGQDYGLRAVVAMAGFGANLAADAIYPNANLDGQGQPLQGGQRYRLHFAAGDLPPAKAFWSVTAYDGDGYLIANPQDRYALGDRDPLHYNADGSLDLWVQHEAPAAEQQANWLPIPASGPFSLTGRIYLPEQRMLDGQWHMPAIERL
ncbi:DUF1254 domain-containing protein [Pseudomonas aeruginosa]|uniref:DUF1254 domain-containing protein n=1 Tax=Pseudomonas aeruginosa TaxID=287 RepID=UPI00210D8D32|nr:DUF1254 domain-containing protein [Pseudomonas aeruginosa]MCT9629223.1 DUF1254 domain-containing protein [Pseudomonas aeruginosa]MCW8036539.1 DUF1254 domain-containing protein [Pseudomonas aeruginosa]